MFDFDGCKNLEDENVVKEGKIEFYFKIFIFIEIKKLDDLIYEEKVVNTHRKSDRINRQKIIQQKQSNSQIESKIEEMEKLSKIGIFN